MVGLQHNGAEVQAGLETHPDRQLHRFPEAHPAEAALPLLTVVPLDLQDLGQGQPLPASAVTVKEEQAPGAATEAPIKVREAAGPLPTSRKYKTYPL